jgi:hypothetical protein
MLKLLALIYRIYALWCRLYNWFEDNTYPKMWLEPYKGAIHPVSSFNRLVEFVEYKKDSWYMLWDVVSTTDAILFREYGDCDDFARMAAVHFGREFGWNGVRYKFKGLCSLTFNTFPHHMVALYQSDSGKCVSIGQSVLFHDSRTAMISHYSNKYKNNHFIKYLGLFDIRNGKIYFKSVEAVWKS